MNNRFLEPNGAQFIGSVKCNQPLLNVKCTLPNQQDIKLAVSRLKKNKAERANQIQAKLYSTGGDKLIRCMYQLVSKIWEQEAMPKNESKRFAPVTMGSYLYPRLI